MYKFSGVIAPKQRFERSLIMENNLTTLASQTEKTAKSPQIADFLRQWANLVTAPLMWVLSSISFFDSNARTPRGLSEINESLLVPFGAAFSIWLPIFIGCIAYGLLQALKTNRTREIFRHIGWWTAAGFTLICIWSLIAAYATDTYAQWGTALVFVPAMLCLVKAMLVATRARAAFDNLESVCVWLPLSLIAGWTSIAVFLNWTPLLMSLTATAMPVLLPNIFMLLIALIWSAFIIRQSGSNRAYAFPIVWGLAFLALKQLVTEPQSALIGVFALIGALLLVGVAAYKPKTDKADFENAYNYV